MFIWFNSNKKTKNLLTEDERKQVDDRISYYILGSYDKCHSSDVQKTEKGMGSKGR